MTGIGEWKIRYQRELDQAYSARASGNEGRARVCARRAAGIIAGEYLRRKGEASENQSAYQRLRIMQEQTGLSGRVQEIIMHLTARVDTDYNLPVQADLLSEVEEFRMILLG